MQTNSFCLPSENLVQSLPESGSTLDPDPDPHIINADLKHGITGTGTIEIQYR
jgi:hypothetical protein